MSQERNRILDLLATGKITAEEAARLLDALEARTAPAAATEVSTAAAGTSGTSKSSGLPKFMYVKVVSTTGDNVNVKIPLSLVRAGLKLTNLIPPPAMEQINKSMADHGMSIDLSNIKPEELEELIASLREMEVNVDAVNGDTVRVYCA
jgi:hypothetical protein